VVVDDIADLGLERCVVGRSNGMWSVLVGELVRDDYIH